MLDLFSANIFPLEEEFHFEAGGKKSLFLHFLNREAPRNLNTRLLDDQFEAILKTILLTTNEIFLSDISYVWENYDDCPKLNKIIVKLIELRVVELISSFHTTDTFLSESRKLYEYDSKRYSIFFDNVPNELFIQQPRIIKNESTSKYILSNLLFLKHDISFDLLNFINDFDRKLLFSYREKLDPIIQKAANAAITLSLFNEEIKDIPTRLAFARFSTLSHFRHYLNFTNSEIVTDINNLYYYDIISNHKIIFNYKLLSLLLYGLGFTDVLNEDPGVFTEKACVIRQSPYQKDFVSNIRCFLNGVFFVVSKTCALNKTKCDYNSICEYIKSILYLKNRHDSLSSKGLFECVKVSSETLRNIIFYLRKDHLFATFLALWEDRMISNKKVLLIVATDLEAQLVIKIAKSNFNLSYSRIHSANHTIYLLGEISKTDIYMVQSEMGKETPGGIILTAVDSIDFLKPDYVICLGIAFGLKPKKQKLGDILVAKQMCGYDLKKVVEKNGVKSVIQRGDKAETTTKLLDRFRSAQLEWSECKIHFGLIMSGSTLSNSTSFTKELLAIEPEAIGGEMEGAGLYSVVAKRKIDWILAKGICDWGKNKTDEYQESAAKNAALFVFHVISQGGLAI